MSLRIKRSALAQEPDERLAMRFALELSWLHAGHPDAVQAAPTEGATERPVTFAELYRYVTSQRQDRRIQGALFREPRLRRDYRRLIAGSAGFALPERAAAASSTSESQRRRVAETIELRWDAPADDGTVVLRLILADPPPFLLRKLIVFEEDDRSVEVALPPLQQGETQIPLDAGDPTQALMLDALGRGDTAVYLA